MFFFISYIFAFDFFFIVNRQIFESCDHSVQCNGTENATLCKDHGIKRLCYCDHGYLEVGGVCLLGHNEYNSGVFLVLKVNDSPLVWTHKTY